MKKKILIGNLVLTAVLILDIVLYIKYDMSLAGYWTDKVLFWLWLLTTWYIIDSHWKKLVAKLYLGVLLLLTIVSMLPMMIPFLAILQFTFAGDRSASFSVNSFKRIQETHLGLAGPRIELIENKLGIFEKKTAQGKSDFELNGEQYFFNEAKSVKLLQEEVNDSLLIRVSFDTISVDINLKKI